MADHCQLCDQAAVHLDVSTDASDGRPFEWTVKCKTCGDYRLDRLTEGRLRASSGRDWRLRGAVRELCELQRERGDAVIPVELDIDNIDYVASRAPARHDVAEKLLRLLRRIAGRSDVPGDKAIFYPNRDYPLCYAKNADELAYYIYCIEQAKWAEVVHGGAWDITLTPAGWQAAKGVPNAESHTAFVAMWFHPGMHVVYDEGIKLGVEQAGYKPVRVDREQYLNKVDDKIIASLREARFAVADFTGNRGGVYYEAGFAAGLGIPVIYTCCKPRIKKVHFDTRQYNHLGWMTPDELREQLRDRILATVGRGPYDAAAEKLNGSAAS